ncbi:MAG TPA: tetratricopeptide repeat protein [Thermoanaerobaculia bacterium]|nr:tetratricopeptide repeat protein [Thermoanaerobaculia bacterium]
MNRAASLSVPGETERTTAGYSTADVGALLGLSVTQVRSYVRAGFLSPAQGSRGEHRFSFQDLILLRTAKGLLQARVPHRRIVLALRNLREQLPPGRPLTGVRISAQGHHVIVRDGGELWNPESGQALLDFEVSELAREAASLTRKESSAVRPAPAAAPDRAEEWYEQGVEWEDDEPERAIQAYRQALQLDPDLTDAHLNLGRLLHESGRPADVASAETHYRRALALRPADATAAFNLGVALQDLKRLHDAVEAYEKALALDPRLPDAHFNLAVVNEELGHKQAAFFHLRSYKTLISG